MGYTLWGDDPWPAEQRKHEGMLPSSAAVYTAAQKGVEASSLHLPLWGPLENAPHSLLAPLPSLTHSPLSQLRLPGIVAHISHRTQAPIPGSVLWEDRSEVGVR